MKRALMLMATLVLAGAWWATRSIPPQPPSPALAEEGRFLICPGGHTGGGFTTRLAVASSVPGPFSIGLLGAQVDRAVAEIPAAGGAVTDLSELGDVGLSPALVEIPTAEAGAATVAASGASLQAVGCVAAPGETLLLPGGTTRTGEHFSVVLANPFAAEAVVRVESSSEVGVDNSPELDAVVVHPGGFTEVDLSRVLSSRDSLNVRLIPVLGRVAAVARQTGGMDVAGWEAVTGRAELFLPLPGLRIGRLSLAHSAGIEVSFSIDHFDEDGEAVGVIEGTIPATGHLDLSLDDLITRLAGLRISASEPIAATVVFDDGPVRAAGAAAPRLSRRWLLPGAGGTNSVELLILNPSDLATQVVISGLVDGARAFSVEILPQGMAAVSGRGLPAEGALVVADGEVAVAWTASFENTLAYQLGVPIDG
jgi:hypothetical protein